VGFPAENLESVASFPLTRRGRGLLTREGRSREGLWRIALREDVRGHADTVTTGVLGLVRGLVRAAQQFGKGFPTTQLSNAAAHGDSR
jgi:hypothetical protein